MEKSDVGWGMEQIAIAAMLDLGWKLSGHPWEPKLTKRGRIPVKVQVWTSLTMADYLRTQKILAGKD